MGMPESRTRNRQVMRRRDLLKSGLLAGGMLPMAGHVDAGERDKRSGLVIDAHCHAGRGFTSRFTVTGVT
jgi:hypothetical protein